jgi:hypothetical protein
MARWNGSSLRLCPPRKAVGVDLKYYYNVAVRSVAIIFVAKVRDNKPDMREWAKSVAELWER